MCSRCVTVFVYNVIVHDFLRYIDFEMSPTIVFWYLFVFFSGHLCLQVQDVILGFFYFFVRLDLT